MDWKIRDLVVGIVVAGMLFLISDFYFNFTIYGKIYFILTPFIPWMYFLIQDLKLIKEEASK